MVIEHVNTIYVEKQGSAEGEGIGTSGALRGRRVQRQVRWLRKYTSSAVPSVSVTFTMVPSYGDGGWGGGVGLEGEGRKRKKGVDEGGGGFGVGRRAGHGN